MSAGQKAGVVIGSIAGFILLVAFFLTLCCWRAIRKRRIPKPDTNPRPLFTARRKSRHSGGEKGGRAYHGADVTELQFPDFKSTSPGPPTDGSGEWVDTFGLEIEKPVRWR